MSRTLLRLKRESGISPETLLRKKASSHVERRIFWFYSSCVRKLGVSLELLQDTPCSSRVETGMLGNFLSCIKGFNDTFAAQEGRWDFSQDAALEKGLI